MRINLRRQDEYVLKNKISFLSLTLFSQFSIYSWFVEEERSMDFIYWPFFWKKIGKLLFLKGRQLSKNCFFLYYFLGGKSGILTNVTGNLFGRPAISLYYRWPYLLSRGYIICRNFRSSFRNFISFDEAFKIKNLIRCNICKVITNLAYAWAITK